MLQDSRLIRNDVKSFTATTIDECPSPNDLMEESTLDYMPISLKYLLSKLFV